MSLEGSTPLSQNPEGNTAAAISDVNDNSILADIEKKSTIQKMVAAENTYGFVHNGKIYLNPESMNSNAAVHEYTHLWDIYRDTENNTVVFVKQEGRLNDFVVVEEKDNKLVFYDSTFLRKGIPSRFEKITPAKKQEFEMS